MSKVYRLTLREDGKYQVLREGNEKPTRVFDSKEDALAYAEELKQEEGVTVHIDLNQATHDAEPNKGEVKADDSTEKSTPSDQSAETPQEESQDESITTETKGQPEEKVGFFKRFWRKLFG